MTADEVDIKGLEAAVRGEGVESPRQEIARLRRQLEPEHYDLDIGKEVRRIGLFYSEALLLLLKSNVLLSDINSKAAILCGDIVLLVCS